MRFELQVEVSSPALFINPIQKYKKLRKREERQAVHYFTIERMNSCVPVVVFTT